MMTQTEFPKYLGKPLLSRTSSRPNGILFMSSRSCGSVSAGKVSGVSKPVDKSSHILEKVARREDGAVEEMLDHYGSLVWSIVKKFCFNPSECEDAAQEIFVELWKYAPRFNPAIANETTFIAMIARRRMIDRMRRQSRQVATTSVDGQENVLKDPDFSGESLERESAGMAMKAFDKLRPEQKQVLGLSIHHGHSHEQISATTGLPLGTVKTHARRGLLRLRELLNSNESRPEHRRVIGGIS